MNTDLAEWERRLPPWTRELLECLSPRRRQAFVLREAGDLTFDNVGDLLGVSGSRARQLHEAAVRVLTNAAKRGALVARHAPEFVTHSLPASTYERCAVPEELWRALVLPLEALDLSVRAANCLENMGVRSIGELVRKTEGELLKTPNMGRKTVREIREQLTVLGLHLGMNTSVLEPQRG